MPLISLVTSGVADEVGGALWVAGEWLGLGASYLMGYLSMLMSKTSMGSSMFLSD